MGLGKTAITLTALNDLILDELEISKILIIAPLRVARDTWPSEISKWGHLHNLEFSLIIGGEKERISAVNTKSLIYIINRENVAWLVDYYHDNGVKWDFDCVVIDELSSFKNHKSKRFKALKKIRNFVKRWVALTGTPAGNGLIDLWSEIGIIDGGERLGRFIGAFREAYFTASSMDPRTGIVYSYKPKKGAPEKIYERISDITISMKNLDYLDMPECAYISHEAKMNAAERKLYDGLKNNMILQLEGGDIDAVNAAVLSQKLMQMSNGAVYDENHKIQEIHGRKLDLLEDLIEASNGQPVLIAYWFRHDKERILTRFNFVREINASKDISDWNAGKIPAALIHPSSAGHGLNIQDGGHILIWFGLTWSLELYQQTNARLWRQGQKNSVSIHHIICKNTIDENILSALASKNLTQEKLINAVKTQLLF